MENEPCGERILNRLLKAAAERWGEAEAERLRPTLASTAAHISKVEGFELGLWEEPAHPVTGMLEAIREGTPRRS